MNYQRIYNELIESSKTRGDMTIYVEKHHVIPRCMGGVDDDNNLVRLTYREHILAHRLLHIIYPDNVSLSRAFFAMTCLPLKSRIDNSGVWYNSRLLAEARESILGIPKSETTKEKIRKFNTGLKHEPHTDETREKIKNSNLEHWLTHKNSMIGIPRSDGIKEKISKAKLGNKYGPQPVEHKQKISKALQGIKRGDKTKQKMKDACKRRKIVTCPHCGKTGYTNNIKQWHFDNCKFITK